MNINLPSEYDFELKINIYGQDRSGEEYKLILHTEKDINNPASIALNYSDMIRKGDVLREKVTNAIKEDYTIDKVLDMEFFEVPIEEDELETDGFEYIVNVDVEYRPEYEMQIGDLYSTWVKMDREDIEQEEI